MEDPLFYTRQRSLMGFHFTEISPQYQVPVVDIKSRSSLTLGTKQVRWEFSQLVSMDEMLRCFLTSHIM
jgi:hypothetical protein